MNAALKEKPLPLAGRPSELPSLPQISSLDSEPPLPPPKLFDDPLPSPGLNIPSTPTSPTRTPSPSDSKKKLNPLTDLIDTEKTYVDQLTGIIRKIAAAWSRSNLPPPDLDTMFRSIEAVYKASRSLHSRLKDIGANPSSPKALGDLLMRWIDDLEAPYTTYCTKYISGFDEWAPVQSNARLATILATFSEANPPPASSSSAHGVWTLDALFLLPKARLKYYKKLYNRLLKNTVPGRSDHKLLLGALEKLDNLLATLSARQQVKPGGPAEIFRVETEDEVVIDLRSQPAADLNFRPDSTRLSEPATSEDSSARGSTGDRLSQETASTSRGSSSTMSTPITDLERRLSTTRTLDIFTMKPKSVRLQISPPSLVFTRELRFSMDVVVTLSSRATGIEAVHTRGHVFLLSDLFLVCERMTSEERAQGGPDGPDMSLCYPPLAGKVLRVSEVPGQDTLIQVAIMRKETLILQTESVQARNFMLSEFRECIEFAANIGPISKEMPPPLPSLPGMSRSPSAPIPNHDQNPLRPHSGNPSPMSHRSQSPSSMQRPDSNGARITVPMSMSNPSSRMNSPDAPFSEGRMSGPFPPRNFASPPNHGPPLSYGPGPGPGQTFPPGRNPPMNAPRQHNSAEIQYQQQQNNSPQYGNNRPPSGPMSLPPDMNGNAIRRTPSAPALAAQYDRPTPPLPPFPGEYTNNTNFNARYDQPPGPLHAPQPRTILPSAQINSRAVSMADPSSFADPSPPNSPVEETVPLPGPVTSTIAAQMKCKVFLKQHHAQWKSLGAAKLKLYRQDPTNVKQLVVEADNKASSVMISTIVLTDGVERVGKTGVAVELSDKGQRTGIVYMIQLRNEKSAGGLFETLLAGSDRVARS